MKKILDKILKVAGVLGAVGAAAWLLIGLFGYNIFDLLDFSGLLKQIVQILAGVGGLMMLKKLF